MTTRFAFVSPYPPTRSGLATFTSSLRSALVGPGADEGLVVRLVDAPAPRPGPEVIAQIVRGDEASRLSAVGHLNTADVVIVQFDEEVFGGPDGADVLPLLDRLEVPSIVVLHSVPAAPTTGRREVLEALIAKADGVVVMTQCAHDRLVHGYAADPDKVRVIPHGASDMTAPAHSMTFRGGQFTALTWGLLRPGQGIEWAIDAMAILGDHPRSPRYTVAGPTHPGALVDGVDAYRDRLIAQVRALNLGASVQFDGHYRDAAALAQLVRASDVVVLPYDSTDQVTSGVLVEAVAAGQPVIATEFPHARELLADGAGILVPHRDPDALAAALRTVIAGGGAAVTMAATAAAATPQLLWPAVAEHYRALASLVITATVAA